MSAREALLHVAIWSFCVGVAVAIIVMKGLV